MSGVSDTKKSIDVLAALGLPACAIVDLDYAFRQAQTHGFLAEDDPDIGACRAVLARLAQGDLITLDAGGLPKKDAKGPASRAFEILAGEADARAHIDALVAKLRAQYIWLWSRGAIEPHVGLEQKSEHAWLTCQIGIETNGVDATCADAAGIRALVDWLSQLPADMDDAA